MKRFLKDKRGFTLIELIMVIVIIGILAAVAIPMYVGLQNKARKAAEEGVVGGIRGGISVYHASLLLSGETVNVWPPQLDYASAGSATSTNPFFGSVLDTAITRDWSKVAGPPPVYTGPGEGSYTYSSGDGGFK